MKEEYFKQYFMRGPQTLIEFESEMVKLEIPTEDTVLKGWKITSLIEPAEVNIIESVITLLINI